MDTHKDVQMIYFKDILFSVLYQWKKVLLFIICFSLLLGGYTLLAGNGADPEYAAYLAKKESADAAAASAQAAYNMQLKYMDESILMQLDPYGYYQGSLTLYVDTNYDALSGSLDKTPHVLKHYASLLRSGSFIDSLSEQLKYEPKYILEILTVTTDAVTATMNIKANCLTKEDAEAVLSAAQNHLTSAYAQVSSAISEHTAAIIENTVNLQTDTNLVTTQRTQQTQLTTLETALNNAASAASAIEAPASMSLKAAVVIGAVLGGFFGVIVLCFAHIFSAKVYSARALRNHTGVKTLAAISGSAKNKLLRKLEGRNTEDTAAQAEVVATNLYNRANGKNLLITSTVDPALAQEIATILSGKGMSVTASCNLLKNADAMAAAGSCDAVIMLEQCGLSRYTFVEQGAETICDLGKELLGCVLIDG